MRKICPSCQIEHESAKSFCPDCGTRLIYDPAAESTVLNLGDANAISGGVNINQSKNISSQDTHYHTTINERQKSENELALDAKNRLRERAMAIMEEKGRIEPISISQLRTYATGLGIEEDSFRSIIKEVRSSRSGMKEGLSSINARYIQQAVTAIQENDRKVFNELMPRLEAISNISAEDKVQYVYNMGLSLFDPQKLIKNYENRIDENYWRTFWTVVTYIRYGDNVKVSHLLANFDPLRYDKPEDDLNLLEAFFNLTRGKKEDARELLDEVFGPSEFLQSFHMAIEKQAFEEETDTKETVFYGKNVLILPDEATKEKLLKSLGNQERVDAEAEDEKKSADLKSEAKEDGKKKEEPDGKEMSQGLYLEALKATGPKKVLLLQQAAEAGSTDAMVTLVDCYYDGEGVKKNPQLAVEWLTKASDLGNPKALLGLGIGYLSGIEGFKQDYNLSIKYLTEAANAKLSEAEGYLSYVYLQLQDYDKALYWAQRGAQIENKVALYVLALIYLNGYGVEPDLQKSFDYAKKAADEGEPSAQFMVGDAYYAGNPVPQDYTQAYKYYYMAAQQEEIEAMTALGECMLYGLGCDQNYDEAIIWLNKAAENNDQKAINILEYIKDGGLIENSSSTQIEAPDTEDHSSQNISTFQFQLQDLITTVDGIVTSVEVNIGDFIAKGDTILVYQAEGTYNNLNTQEEGFVRKIYVNEGDWMYSGMPVMEIGDLLSKEETENSTEKNFSENSSSFLNDVPSEYYYDGAQINQYKESAKGGDNIAMAKLALCYLSGAGIKQNDKMAVMWFKRAAENNDAFASYMLGERYSSDSSPLDNPNYQEAAKWYRRGAKLNFPPAMFALGLLYFNGQGVVANNEKGKKLITDAAHQDYQEAIDYIKGNPEIFNENKKVKPSKKENIKNKVEKKAENQAENNATPPPVPTPTIPKVIGKGITYTTDGHKMLFAKIESTVFNMKGQVVDYGIEVFVNGKLKSEFIGESERLKSNNYNLTISYALKEGEKKFNLPSEGHHNITLKLTYRKNKPNTKFVHEVVLGTMEENINIYYKRNIFSKSVLRIKDN